MIRDELPLDSFPGYPLRLIRVYRVLSDNTLRCWHTHGHLQHATSCPVEWTIPDVLEIRNSLSIEWSNAVNGDKNLQEQDGYTCEPAVHLAWMRRYVRGREERS